MYDYYLDMIAINQMTVMAIFFFIILIFGKLEYKLHSLVIFTSSILAYFLAFDSLIIPTKSQYVNDLMISMSWDGVSGLIMTMFLTYDKKASKQAALLAFAVTVHTVVLWDQDIHSSFISSITYYWYDELIITIGLLQMMVSYNGFINAFSGLSRFAIRAILCSHGLGKGLLARKERASKT